MIHKVIQPTNKSIRVGHVINIELAAIHIISEGVFRNTTYIQGTTINIQYQLASSINRQ